MVFIESETIELKRSTSELNDGIISIVAILNKHHKGRLCFGIRHNGEVIGQTVVEKTIRDVSKSIADHIEPKIYPKITKEIIGGKDCIVVDFEGTDTPYFAFGRVYIRVGDEDRQLSAKEIENFILRKNRDRLRWDNQLCNKATLNDISSTKLRAFLKRAGLKYDTVENGLNKLKLISEGKILNTAVILFGKEPEDFFPNAKLRCAVFGTTGTSYIIDMQDYIGDLFYLIEKAEEYILKNIHIGMRIEGLYRVDVPEINKEAFREAIINAFCHRDYYEYDSVNVAIFRDRLEIRSPGLLFAGLTIEKIKTEFVSERRNELMAEMFHIIHFVERWGRGIDLILSKEPTADFKEVGTHFITFSKRKNADEGVEKGVEKGVERLSSNEQVIIGLIKGNPSISKGEMIAQGGLSKKTVEYNIQKLKNKGILRRVGAPKGGHWEIAE